MDYEEICRHAMDTVHSCHDVGKSAYHYVNTTVDGGCGFETCGNYPVPAIPLQVSWDYCWCMGQRTAMHVIWWRCVGDGTHYSTKAIIKD